MDAANGILANAIDPEGQPLTVTLLNPGSGTVTLNADGSFVKTTTMFSRFDFFTYEISDGVNTTRGLVAFDVTGNAPLVIGNPGADPTPTPDPDPTPEPDPTPVPDPTPDPEPTPDPDPQPLKIGTRYFENRTGKSTGC